MWKYGHQKPKMAKEKYQSMISYILFWNTEKRGIRIRAISRSQWRDIEKKTPRPTDKNNARYWHKRCDICACFEKNIYLVYGYAGNPRETTMDIVGHVDEATYEIYPPP